jgi:hypothetical protein
LTDAPTYPWNHSKTYWFEGHQGIASRFRKWGRQDIIGSPDVGSTIFEPRWRGFIRVSENPWVQDHQVQNTIIYPAAGMMAMVIEAACQVQDEALLVDGYELLNMSIEKAMIIPMSIHGLETSLNMRRKDSKQSSIPRNLLVYEFAIYSKIRDASWQRNSSGELRIHYKSSRGSTRPVETTQHAEDQYTTEYSIHKNNCNEEIIARQLYETLESIGMKYGPLFQNITDIHKKDGASCSTIKIPDTKSIMPAQYEYPHLIHPATLDAAFQTVFVAGNEPMVPSFVESLFVSADFPRGAGAHISGYSTASRHGLRDALGNITMFDEPATLSKPKLIVKNLHFTALSSAPDDLTEAKFMPTYHNLCAEVSWKEDVSFSNTKSLTEWVDLVAYKSPNMNILDVSRENGGFTKPMLRALGKISGAGPRFSNYCYTRSSSMEVSLLEKELHDWTGYMSFKTLDLDIELVEQGFKLHSFDLIVSDYSDQASLSKLKQLLKSQGRLILHNIGSQALTELPVKKKRKLNSEDFISVHQKDYPASLPQFADISGFRILNHLSSDFEIAGPGEKPTSLVISSSKPANMIQLSSAEIVFLLPVCPSENLQVLSRNLASRLKYYGSEITTKSLLDPSTSVKDKLCLAFLEIDSPLIYQWTSHEFHAFRSLISQAKGCFWVTKGGQMKSGAPFSAPINALLRTIRSEDQQKGLYSLDLDVTTKLDANSTLEAVLATFVTSFDLNEASREVEYAEFAGKIFIPRIILQERLNFRIEQGDSPRQPQMLPFAQNERRIQLEIGTPGKLDSLFFNYEHTPVLDLGPGEIEISVSCVAINSSDGRATLGHTASDMMGSVASGIVTNVGSLVQNFKPGDYVIAVVAGAFKSFIRTSESMVWPTSADISLESILTLLYDSASAYYAIKTSGNLQMGESVLINSTDVRFSQVATQIALDFGAEVFMAADTSEESTSISEISGLKQSHIIDSSCSSLYRKINELTQGRGVDLILNSMTGEPRDDAWKCIRECEFPCSNFTFEQL